MPAMSAHGISACLALRSAGMRRDASEMISRPRCVAKRSQPWLEIVLERLPEAKPSISRIACEDVLQAGAGIGERHQSTSRASA